LRRLEWSEKTTAGKKTKEKKQKKDKEIYPPLNPKPLYSPRRTGGSRKRATAGSRKTRQQKKPADGRRLESITGPAADRDAAPAAT
jgi:hypothetical protein